MIWGIKIPIFGLTPKYSLFRYISFSSISWNYPMMLPMMPAWCQLLMPQHRCFPPKRPGWTFTPQFNGRGSVPCMGTLFMLVPRTGDRHLLPFWPSVDVKEKDQRNFPRCSCLKKAMVKHKLQMSEMQRTWLARRVWKQEAGRHPA